MSDNLKIGIHTWGSEGDIRPLIALARQLSFLGNNVSLVYTSVDGRNYDHLTDDSRINVTKAGNPYFESCKGLELKDLKGHQIKQVDNILGALLDPVIDDIYKVSFNICHDQDINFVHFLDHPAIAAIDKCGKKAIPVITAPVIPSRDYTSIGMDFGFLNKIIWYIASPVVNHILVRKRIDPFRKAKGLLPVRSYFKNWLDRFPLTFTAVSPSIFPKPADWGMQHHISGFIDDQNMRKNWRPSDTLRKFLDAGDPPVFITFGSMLSYNTKDARDSVDLLVDAAKISGLRTIIQVPKPLLDRVPRTDMIFPLSYAPHTLIFPECSAVVHHGGAGTTHSVTRSACPSIIVPHLVDQFFWGPWLYKRGLSPAPINRKDLTAFKLAKRMVQAKNSKSMKDMALKISKAMHDEDGIEYIVRYLDHILSKN